MEHSRTPANFSFKQTRRILVRALFVYQIIDISQNQSLQGRIQFIDKDFVIFG